MEMLHLYVVINNAKVELYRYGINSEIKLKLFGEKTKCTKCENLILSTNYHVTTAKYDHKTRTLHRLYVPLTLRVAPAGFESQIIPDYNTGTSYWWSYVSLSLDRLLMLNYHDMIRMSSMFYHQRPGEVIPAIVWLNFRGITGGTGGSVV